MSPAMHHNKRLTADDSAVADERIRRRAAQLAAVLALNSDHQRGRQATVPRAPHVPVGGTGAGERGTQHAATQSRAAARSRQANSSSNDTRKTNARAQQQVEILQRIDDNLRRLRQLAETRSAALAVFTPPEH